mmetsp:Transcript_19796/g.27221  ORF Transcript_19796/g.27221 Transcript_19796/m.27221 type:complete len:281 (+) Transcript_19796:534-1376(+)
MTPSRPSELSKQSTPRSLSEARSLASASAAPPPHFSQAQRDTSAMAQPPPPAPVSLQAYPCCSHTARTASRRAWPTPSASSSWWLMAMSSDTAAKLSAKQLRPPSGSSPVPCSSSLKRSEMAWMLSSTGSTTSGRRLFNACTRATSERVLRGWRVLSSSRRSGGSAPSCSRSHWLWGSWRRKNTKPPRQEVVLSRPEGEPCSSTSAAKAHWLMVRCWAASGTCQGEGAAPRRRQQAAARATEKAAEDPRPAPMGSCCDRTVMSTECRSVCRLSGSSRSSR